MIQQSALVRLINNARNLCLHNALALLVIPLLLTPVLGLAVSFGGEGN